MRLLYIIAIVVAVLFAFVLIYLVEEVSWMMWSSGDFYTWMIIGTLVIQIFNAFYILLFCFTIKHIKRTTSLVLSIIGISLTGIMFLLNMFSFVEPFAFFDITPFHIFLIPVLLAFSIVNLVQANIYSRPARVNDRTIDDVM